ncbi:MAG: hypothetical protein AAGD25_32985 [Cyanobacteria bacterium P01_F01_bin.150]
MVQNFPEPDCSNIASENQIAAIPEASPERDCVRFMLVGTSQGVARIIHELHLLRFAEVSEWSKPMPTKEHGKIMRVMTKNVLL